MFSVYDSSSFPLVKVKITGIPSNDDFDEFLRQWLQLYEEMKDFSFLFDIRELGNVSLKYCVKMAMFIYKLRKREYQYLKKSVIVLNDNKIQRLLDFIFAIQSPVADVFIYNNNTDSIEDLELFAHNISLVNLENYENVMYIEPN
tara:strand:- start:25 stop:459 length:435 start_codon:yes stop_codon:yes gene_type:complete